MAFDVEEPKQVHRYSGRVAIPQSFPKAIVQASFRLCGLDLRLPRNTKGDVAKSAAVCVFCSHIGPSVRLTGSIIAIRATKDLV